MLLLPLERHQLNLAGNLTTNFWQTECVFKAILNICTNAYSIKKSLIAYWVLTYFISLTMETSSEVGTTAEKGNIATTTNDNQYNSIITENTRLREENAKITAQLALSEKRVAELEAQIGLQKPNLEEKFSNSFEQRANQESRAEQACAIRSLENLVAKEHEQRLDAELELEHLKDSCKRADRKCGKGVNGFGETVMITEVKQNLFRLKEQFDELSKYMQVQLESDEEELMSLATQIQERNQRLQNLIKRLNPQRLSQLIEPLAKTNEEARKPGKDEVNAEKRELVDGQYLGYAKKPRTDEQ